MLASFRIIKDMVLDNWYCTSRYQREILFLKHNSIKIKLMGMEELYLTMVNTLKVCFKRIN